MSIIGKYYKHSKGICIVKATSEIVDGTFTGEVVVADNETNVGETQWWTMSLFEPYHKPFEITEAGEEKTIIANPTPTKDTELRLECLKLALNTHTGITTNSESVLADAKTYYEWVTQEGKL